MTTTLATKTQTATSVELTAKGVRALKAFVKAKEA
jgi:hypothetical protein